jgi:hypothetical protein
MFQVYELCDTGEWSSPARLPKYLEEPLGAIPDQNHFSVKVRPTKELIIRPLIGRGEKVVP